MDRLSVLRRARLAVGGLFVINAAAYANIVPRLPGLKAELGLSNVGLGSAVAAVPAGALASGLAAGALISRWGSARVATVCGAAFALVVPAVSFADSWATLAAIFFVFGLVDSVMDVAMNAHALRVQRGYGRSIVSGFHGLWSLGAVAGAGAASAAVGVDVAIGTHLAVAGLALAALTAAARLHLLPGPDDTERGDLSHRHDSPVIAVGTSGADAPGEAAEPADDARIGHDADLGVVTGSSARSGNRARHTSRFVTLLSLSAVLVLAGAVEDSPASWGAVLLRGELGASAALGGLVFVAFQSTMTAGRLVADRAIDRLGSVVVLRVGGALIAVGAGSGLLVGTPASVAAGFAVAGLGAAPLLPVVFHAAGNLPGLATGHGVAVVAWASRLGFLVVPPFVGLMADAASVRTAIGVVALAGLGLIALVGAVDDA